MGNGSKLLNTLLAINSISSDRRLEFEQKLQRILLEVARCMRAERGSIMLVKGRKNLEVAASTNPSLIGLKQPIDETSPSSWVVKNRAPLRLENIAESDTFQEKFEDYKGAAFLLVPIIGNGRVIGVLNVTDKIDEGAFTSGEQEALLNIAGQIISALENQRLAKSLQQKQRALQKKNLDLKRLEKLKSELFSMLIHDLKGPISEMVANLDILSYTLTGEELDYVRAAQSGCDTLYRMVSNLLDIARLEEHRLQLVYEKIDPALLIQESMEFMSALAGTKGLRIVEALPSSGTAASLWGDRGILLRVLQNLLSNAIQYSPHNETIEVGCSYLKPPSGIEFFVQDNGPGIPEKYHEAIFDKFKQLEKKNDGRIYSTGLGLTFCKMAVEAHKGEMMVSSDGIKGSRFYFSLPLGKKT